MKISADKLIAMAQAALNGCLSGIQFLKITEQHREVAVNGLRADMTITVKLPGAERLLIAEVKNNGQPRYAREAVNQLLAYLRSVPNGYGVFIAPYITSQAAEICNQANIGYVDLSGNCRLCFDQVFIEREGRPNKFAQKRDIRTLYSPKAERVLRVLLTGKRKAWKMTELATEARVSLGQVANVKKLLADRDWIEVVPKGLQLTRPLELLEEWSESYHFNKHRIYKFYSLNKIGEIEESLAKICSKNNMDYALTAFSGASRLAPHVRYQRAYAFVEIAVLTLTEELGFKAIDSGENIALVVPYDEGVYYGSAKMDGVMVASPVQVYLDALSLHGRGAEAAQAILEEKLKPQW